ncbi:MAG: hypothetical protein LBH73_07545, partial [Spirochaetaceae bacterium]|nr:hypothetical protein [Spirochaetaceae bacterium]
NAIQGDDKSTAHKNAVHKSAALPTPEAITDYFEAWLAGLLSLETMPRDSTASVSGFLRELASTLQEKPEAPLVVLGYGVFRLLKLIAGNPPDGKAGAALSGHWQLDRKLAEAFGILNMDDAKARWNAGLVRAALAWDCCAGQSGAPVKKQAAAFMLENYNNDDFRRLLGVNRFDDITWFNKECFEDALFYGCLFNLPGADDKKLRRVADMEKLFRKAGKSSGYKLDDLLTFISGPVVYSTGESRHRHTSKRNR